MLKREFYLNQIRPLFNKNMIKVLTGVRRSGKSVLLESIKEELIKEGVKEENILLINFEFSEYFDLNNIKKLEEFINKNTQNIEGKIYLLFDEIQEVENWEKLINSYHAKGNYDIYITGSNSHLLSGELATYLSGRYIRINIYPFSFKEFLEYYLLKNDLDENILNNNTLFYSLKKNLFVDYLTYGGLPILLTLSKNEKLKYLKDIYSTIVLNDIISRYNVRDVDLLNRILRYLLSNIGQLFNANNVSNYLNKNENKANISINTVYNYLSYFEAAYLVHKVRRYDVIGKSILNRNEKYYIVDLGFRESLFGRNQGDISQTLENIVYIDLIRRGYNVNVGVFKDKEIDFVCRKNGKKIYVQVSYILSKESTIEREFSSLSKIEDNYPKYVISMDEIDLSRDGIKHMNIIDFLLTDDLS